MARYRSFLDRMRREPYEPASPASGDGDLGLARARLASLPSREREAFVLLAIEELSSVEAARVMGISDSTVRVLAGRARTRLQKGLGITRGGSMRAEGKP